MLCVLKEASSGGITRVGVVATPSEFVEEWRFTVVELSDLPCLLGESG